MLRFTTQRALFGVVTFLCVITAVFFLMRLAPGGPFDGERRLPAEVEANLRAAYHLDEPLGVQYLRYLSMLCRGDLGPSFRQKDFDVNELVSRGLPISGALGITALLLALTSGLAIGVTAGMRSNSRIDQALMALSNLNVAIPTLVTAPVVILVFAVTLSWLPAGGVGSWLHFILPSIALALPFSAAIARLTRGSVVETKHEPHLQTARAKGLSERRILWRHIMPIAIIPVLSYLGPAAAALITGSVVVEQVFDLPGIGRYFVQGALNRDYTLVMGVVVIYAGAILVFNWLVDLAYAALDPRIGSRDGDA